MLGLQEWIRIQMHRCRLKLASRLIILLQNYKNRKQMKISAIKFGIIIKSAYLCTIRVNYYLNSHYYGRFEPQTFNGKRRAW